MKKKFLNFDVQNEFNRRQWKQSVDKQTAVNELERIQNEGRKEELALFEQQKRTEVRELEKATIREAWYKKQEAEEQSCRYDEEMKRYYENVEYEKRRKEYEWAKKMNSLCQLENFLQYGPYDPNEESALDPYRG
jgi:hypothetical protein